jgi:hypothetical protein
LTNFRIKKAFGIIGSLLIAFFILPSVVPAEDMITSGGKRPVRIAIIPFQSLLPEEGSGNAVISPIHGAGYSGGKIDKGANEIVGELFTEKLNAFKDVKIMPSEKVNAFYGRINAESLKKPVIDVLKKTGAELGVDILAVGYVFRYMERIGYDYSAEKPASVGFEISFINVKNGEAIWHGVFDKTQKSLMEDVFQISSFYKGGGKWLTARQLTQQGLDEVLKTFSGFDF